VRASQFREAASGAGAGYGGERGRERGGEEGEGRDEGVRVGEEHAVPFLGCAPAPIREGRRKRQKWERGDMSGAWWGKNKKKGREGGYVGGGGKKGKEKNNNNNNLSLETKTMYQTQFFF
jgi:hypothetical protein